MGYSHWSDQAFQDRQQRRRRSRQSAFTYDQEARRSARPRVHPQMDPRKVVRESRDSHAHPDSLAIGVIFDVTGSMGTVPRVLQTKLGALMRVLVQKGYVAHPQILFGAVGDAYTDQVPLQMGQFESGLEMDDDLGKIYLEGGGGGQVHESYELAAYFFARHTRTDCFERRGQRGFLFTVGDEMPYAMVKREQVRRILGDRLEADIPTPAILAEVQERYHHFHLVPTNTYHGRSREVQETWRRLLGERLLILEDEGAVCETIALAVGLCLGTLGNLDAGASDLTAAGYDRDAVTSASSALARYAARGPRWRVVE